MWFIPKKKHCCFFSSTWSFFLLFPFSLIWASVPCFWLVALGTLNKLAFWKRNENFCIKYFHKYKIKLYFWAKSICFYRDIIFSLLYNRFEAIWIDGQFFRNTIIASNNFKVKFTLLKISKYHWNLLVFALSINLDQEKLFSKSFSGRNFPNGLQI